MDLDERLAPLRHSCTGLVSPAFPSHVYVDEEDFPIRSVHLGNVQAVMPVDPGSMTPEYGGMSGSGGLLGEKERTESLAVAEALERYCSVMYNESQFIECAATDLGDGAIRLLESLPAHSKGEVAITPRLRKPTMGEPLRWVNARSLLSSEIVPVPAVCVYLAVEPAFAVENFWNQISTGCAVHTNYSDAIVNGFLEVVERDAVATWWLLNRRLPVLSIDGMSGGLEQEVESFKKRNSDLKIVVDRSFPGIFTFIGVESTAGRCSPDSVVAAATSTEPAVALTKLLRELASCRMALGYQVDISTEGAHQKTEFENLYDGALHVGSRPFDECFGFMSGSNEVVKLSDLSSQQVVNGRENDLNLARIIELFRSQGRDILVANTTTQEAEVVGMCSVRVLVPSLQPMSFFHRGRYLGHSRIKEVSMIDKIDHENINPLPIPMA